MTNDSIQARKEAGIDFLQRKDGVFWERPGKAQVLYEGFGLYEKGRHTVWSIDGNPAPVLVEFLIGRNNPGLWTSFHQCNVSCILSSLILSFA